MMTMAPLVLKKFCAGPVLAGAMPALLLVSACSDQGDEHQAGASGQQLFLQYCAACHGRSGEGKFIKGAPAIFETRLTRSEVAELVIEGRKGHRMPEFPRMRRHEAFAVATYFLTLSKR